MAETRKPFSELAGFFPKQQLALEATKSYRYVLYGGSLGSGKSRWLRWICVYWLLTWAARGHRGVRVGLFCEDYPALNDRHIGRIRSEFPDWLGDFNEQRHEFTLKPRFGSGVIAFRNLDDPSKYLCFHPDTEIMTDRGFVNVGDVMVGDMAATMNIATRKATYRPVSKVWSYDFDGELVETRNGKHHVAFSVTPNHELVARTARGKLQKYRADRLPSEFHVPRSASWDGGATPRSWVLEAAELGRAKKPLEVPIVPWLKFLGWYLSEGSCERGRYGVSISQKKPDGRAQLRRDLLDFPYRFHWNEAAARCNGKALYRYVSTLGDSYTKRIPREVMGYHPSLLRHLFDSLMAGDGSVTSSGEMVYVTASRGLCDDVSELAIKLGLVPTVTVVQPKNPHGVGEFVTRVPLYRIYVTDRGDTRVRRSNLVRTPYRGKVCCVTVPPHGTVLTRFRNRVSWTGQSTEFALVAVDEVNRNPYQTFLELRKRLRWPGIDDVRMAFACNPVGEAWVKRYWVDRIFPPEEGERDQFFYVRALPTDNPHLPASYFDNLKSLPERERRAYLDGDWEAFETLRDQDGWYKLLTSTEVESASVDQSDGRFGHAGATFIGLDPGGGGDRSGAVVRSDVLAEVLLDERTNDTMSMVPMVVSWCQARKVDAVVVDLGGLGKPIYDRLCEVQGSLNGAEIIGVQMASRPSDAARYRDLKSEMLLGARGWVLGGGRLSRSHSWNELTVCRYRPDSDQRYRVMGKDEMLRGGVESPNVAEALAYTFAPQCATISMRMHQTGLAERYREQTEQERFGFVQQP